MYDALLSGRIPSEAAGDNDVLALAWRPAHNQEHRETLSLIVRIVVSL